jgi:hypothetical protein
VAAATWVRAISCHGGPARPPADDAHLDHFLADPGDEHPDHSERGVEAEHDRQRQTDQERGDEVAEMTPRVSLPLGSTPAPTIMSHTFDTWDAPLIRMPINAMVRTESLNVGEERRSARAAVQPR